MFEFIVALILFTIAALFIYILLYAAFRGFRRWSRMTPEERKREREQKWEDARREYEAKQASRHRRCSNIPKDTGGDEYLFDD
ncbi:MAG: hypothetical protein IJT12_03960 [Paludibacteraceae bacterium]|nr:hypothetical protein [Paludibacteraceae bacterium]